MTHPHHMRTLNGCRSLTVLVPAALWDAVKREATRTSRSMNRVAVQALETYIIGGCDGHAGREGGRPAVAEGVKAGCTTGGSPQG